MATIVKRDFKKSSRYYVVFRQDKKQIWKPAGNRRRAAERLKTEIEQQLHHGVYQEIPEISFEAFAEKFLEAQSSRIRDRSLEQYQSHLTKRAIPFFKGRKLKSIRPIDCEAFLSHLKKGKIAPITIAKYLKTLKTLFRRACEWGYLIKNPAEFIRPPRVELKEIDCLSSEEMEKLIAAADERYRPLIMLACYTGLRQSEALGLSWDDVQFETNQIFVRRTYQKGKFYKPKTKASWRTVPIPPKLAQALKTHQLKQVVTLSKNLHNLVFTNELGHPLDKSNLNRRILRPALARADLRQIRWHDLRHSFATALLSKGENLKFVQMLLGHSSPSITLNIYSHILPETEKDAAERIERALIKNNSD